MQQTTDGGYILGGYSYSSKSGDKSQINRGKCYNGYCSADYWIVKLRADGSKEWDKSFGGYRDDKLTSIRQTQDGGYIIAGSSISGKGGDKSQGMQGGSDIWVLKLTAEGTKVWDRTFHKAGYDMAASIQQTRDGGYILGGTSNAANWDTGNYWVIKLREDGTKEWDKTIQADRADYLVTLQQTSDDGYILGGNSISGVGGDKTEPHKGGQDPEENYLYSDYWIVKLRPDGSKEWDKTLGGTASDDLTSLQQTNDGGYIVGGTSWSEISGDKSEPTKNGSLDYWVVKLKADGTKEWDKTVGGFAEDFLSTIQETKDGGYILGGWSPSGIGGDKTDESKGGYDFWIVKIKSDGSKEWDRTLGGNGHDELTSIQETRDGGYIVGGTSWSEISGDKSAANKGSCDKFDCPGDYWIIKLEEEELITTSWDMRYGGNGTDNLTSIIKTTDGGFLSGGYTNSGVSGDKSQTSQGKNDYWIVKSNMNGKKLWDKRYGGSGEDYLNTLIQTADGGYLLAGSSLSGVSGDKTQDSRGERDYWVIKIDKQGTRLWDKRFGGSGMEELKQVLVLPSGSFILAGTSNSPVSGDISQANYGASDYWVIKINRSGKKIWDKRFGGAQHDVLEGLAFTQDGGFLLGGSSTSGISGTKSQVSQGASDYWLVRITGEGEKVWEKTYGGSGNDQLMALGSTGTSSGNFFLAGTSTSGKSGDKSQPSQGGKDYWLLKITGTGKKIWDKRYGGSQDEELRTIHMTPEGGYLLGGSSNSAVSGEKSQASQGASDYWIVKTSATGVKEWDQRFGGSGKEELRSVLLTKEGGYLLAGWSDSGVSGDRTQPSQGSTDYWLVKVAPTNNSLVATRETTEVGEPVIKNESFHLQAFPNPVRENATIRFTLPETQATTIRVLDNQGREVATLFQQEAKANQTYQVEWQAGKQASGMYLLQLQTPTRQSTQKLLLAK